jgi:hypothetical protein
LLKWQPILSAADRSLALLEIAAILAKQCMDQAKTQPAGGSVVEGTGSPAYSGGEELNNRKGNSTNVLAKPCNITPRRFAGVQSISWGLTAQAQTNKAYPRAAPALM